MSNEVEKESDNENKEVWVCLACGKRSNDRYGYDPISRGWDESCMLNSSRFKVDRLVLNSNGRVTEIKGETND
jgi:hypothetical protein